jgi:nitroreductase
MIEALALIGSILVGCLIGNVLAAAIINGLDWCWDGYYAKGMAWIIPAVLVLVAVLGFCGWMIANE